MNQNISKLVQNIGKAYKQDSRSVWVELPSSGIMKALQSVRDATERISDITTYDNGKGRLELTYRFCIEGVVLNVKTAVSSKDPKLPTCTSLFPGALLVEREQHEMFGVVFTGHPGLKGLLFAGNTPETPLRKRAKGVKE